jgi:uncharacterized protein (DUF1697 family)
MARKNAGSRYVAFLRGINVGGHRVKMEQLRDLFTALGFSNVATFIASGNVIFEAPAVDAAGIEERIEGHLKKSLGYEVETFLRTPTDLAAVVAFRPFASGEVEAPGHTLHVAFLRNALGDEAGQKVLSLRTALDDFRIHGREVYWLCRGKVTDSMVSWPLVAKTVAMPSTMRNLTTIRKLAALYPPDHRP